MHLECRILFLFVISLFVSQALVWCSIQYVTCDSLVKLVNSERQVRLHSHDVKYGSGSGQQSVTAVQDVDDSNSYWQIKSPFQRNQCTRGSAIKCGDIVRLLHVNTNKYLHSHRFSAPLTETMQEVSAYDELRSDTGDNWEVVCTSDIWRRDDEVKLKHVDTKSFLLVSGSVYGRPIKGQFEVAATKNASPRGCGWKTAEGVFVKPDDGPIKSSNEDQEDDEDLEEDEHDEL